MRFPHRGASEASSPPTLPAPAELTLFDWNIDRGTQLDEIVAGTQWFHR